MADLDERVKKEIDNLRTLRDELRVQMNLGGKEAKSLFEGAEKSWQKLEGRVRLVGKESKKELDEIKKAARPLLEEIQRAYTKLRELI
jgi:hypothetical protein